MTDPSTTDCPECDSSWITRRTRTLAKNETGLAEFHCQRCGAAFDAPDARDVPEVVADD